MKLIKGYPPNIDQIKATGLEVNEDSLFCYGEDLYTPSGKEPPPDILYHESIHVDQQERWGSPETWWNRYLYDPMFRLDSELEAFAKQYHWVKKFVNAKGAKECLDEVSEILSSKQYKLGISKSEAESLIRHYAI